MATSVQGATVAVPRFAPSSSLARRIALDSTVPAVMFASAAIVIGLHWDISWHRSIGRDTFWSPPHVLEQVAAAVAGIFCGWRVLYTSFFGGTDDDRSRTVRWWGLFHGPLGGWVCIWGTIAMISSAPFDDWWHAAYGLDVEILTPPHVILLLGMVTIQLGAMLMMLAEQNRLAGVERSSRLFAFSMGLIVLMMATMVFSDTAQPQQHHRPAFYMIGAGIYPLFLVAAARAGRTRWSATMAALTYMVVLLLLDWVLALVPATPKLAPIYNPITHLVPPGTPLLLVVPALLIDLLVRRVGPDRDNLLAVALGATVVATMFAVQWPLASWLLTLPQPTYLLGLGYWEYANRLGPWVTQFWGVPGQTYQRNVGYVGAVDWGAIVRGLVIATGLGIVSSRVGLSWGRWMTKVRC
jgi:hypothetical protein